MAHLSFGGGESTGDVLQVTSSFCAGQMAFFLLDQIIPDWLVTIMPLGEVETAIRFVLSSQ